MAHVIVRLPVGNFLTGHATVTRKSEQQESALDEFDSAAGSPLSPGAETVTEAGQRQAEQVGRAGLEPAAKGL